MAMHLGGIAGASFCYCGYCRRPLSGVVIPEGNDGNVVDVIALGCVWCGCSTEVRAGILSSSPQRMECQIGEVAD
jgi:hypothetical protein